MLNMTSAIPERCYTCPQVSSRGVRWVLRRSAAGGGSFLPEFQVAHELLHGHVVQKHKVGFPILQTLVLCHDAGVS